MSTMKLHVNWVHGKCKGDVYYLEKDRICYVCGNYLKTCSTTDSTENCVEGPSECISCIATDWENKHIAVSSRSVKPVIYIAEYPDLHVVISKLENGAEFGYQSLCFSGTDYLIALEEAPHFHLVLWDWTTQTKLHHISHTLSAQEAEHCMFTKHPTVDELFCFQLSNGVFFFEIDDFQRVLKLVESSIYVPLVGDESGESAITTDDIENLTCFDKMRHVPWGIHTRLLHDMPLKVISGLNHSQVLELYDNLLKQKRLQTSCHCWIDNLCVAIACANGTVLLVDKNHMTMKILHHSENEESIVRLMAFNANGLYVAKSDNCVYLIKDPFKWELTFRFTLDMEIPICMKISPDYKDLAFVTTSGSIVVWDSSKETIHCFLSNRNSSPLIAVYSVNLEYCITARKNGLIEVWNIERGEVISFYDTGEIIEFMEGSPFCQMMILSFERGYICVIDATNLESLRIVFYSRPCNSKIKLVKYDDFGRFAVLVSNDCVVLVLSTIPSFGFKVLGYCHKPFYFNCMSVLSMSLEEETSVFFLGSHNVTENNASELLVKISLPKQFDTNYRQYWKNESGKLKDEAINLKKIILKDSVSSVVAKSPSVIIIYNPATYEIQMIELDSQHESLVIKRIISSCQTFHELDNCSLLMSPMFNVLLSVNEDGKLFVYLSDTLKLIFGAYLSYCILDGVGKPCNAMTRNEKAVICGTVDGILISHRCVIKKTTSAPHPCLTFIDNFKSKEELALAAMRVQENIESDNAESWILKKSHAYNTAAFGHFEAHRQQLQQKMDSIKRKCDAVVEKNLSLPQKHQIPSTELILDDEVHDELQSLRSDIISKHRMILKVQLNEEVKKSDEIKDECLKSMMVKGIELKSLRGGRTINNYAIKKIKKSEKVELNHVHKKVQIATFEQEVRRRRSLENVKFREKNIRIEEVCRENCGEDLEEEMEELGRELIQEPFHLKTREQRIDYVILLKYIIFSKKMTFNKKFNKHVKHKKKLLHEIREGNMRAREIMTIIHEQHEIWDPDYSDETSDARFDCKEDEVKTSKDKALEEESDRLKGIASYFLTDPWITQRKEKVAYVSARERITAINLRKEMEKILQTIKENVDDFEEKHHQLINDKLLNDMDVFQFEMQLVLILFVVAVGSIFKKWEVYYKKEILRLEASGQLLNQSIYDIDSAIANIEKRCNLLREDGKMLDHEVLQMSYYIKNRQNFLEAYQRRPEVKIIKNPLNPFSQNKNIFIEKDLVPLFDEMNEIKYRPKKVDAHQWKQMCDIRLKKAVNEKKLEHSKHVLQQYYKERARIKERQSNHAKITEHKNQLFDECHQMRLKCLSDTPKVIKAKDSDIEMKYPDELDFSKLLYLEKNDIKVLNSMIGHIGEEKLILVKVIEEAVFHLEKNQSKLRKMQLDLNDMEHTIESLKEIPNTKEVQRLVTNPGAMNPFTKVTALERSVDLEKNGLQKQIDKTNKRMEKTMFEMNLLKRQMGERLKEIDILRQELDELKKMNVSVENR